MIFDIQEYCPPNETLVPKIWAEHGTSQCFTETISSAAALGYILIFGTIQLMFYRKYAMPVEHYALPFSQLFGLQVRCSFEFYVRFVMFLM